jgi:type IV secretory pathway component VirB8
MALKLNKQSNGEENPKIQEESSSYVKKVEEESTGPKLFQNKAANKALIIVGIAIGVLILAAVILVNVQLPWK